MTLPRPWENADDVIGVDDALRRVLAAVDPLPAISVPLIDAFGLTLARDVIAQRDVPLFANSAMDGYAVRASDTADHRTRTLAVVETIAAGSYPTRMVGPEQAARIMTGAPIPAGADAVIRFEETDERSRTAAQRDWILILRAVRAGENIREAGEDLRAGSPALTAGSVIGPIELGMLASVHVSTVPVHRKPCVGIVSTGDELIQPGQPLRPGQIPDSNSFIIQSLVRQAGGEPRMLGIAGDSESDLIERLGAGARPDLYVTSGGVSVGDYDVIKEVLRSEGTIDIWQVRMKPGRPLAFGSINGVPLLGLPGNPFAALVAFLQFGRPLIRRMLGRSDLTLPVLQARLTQSIENRGNRRQFVRGAITQAGLCASVCPLVARASGMFSSELTANGLIVVPEDVSGVAEGATVSVQLFDEARP